MTPATSPISSSARTIASRAINRLNTSCYLRPPPTIRPNSMPATKTTIAVPSGRSSISSSTDCAVVFASDQPRSAVSRSRPAASAPRLRALSFTISAILEKSSRRLRSSVFSWSTSDAGFIPLSMSLMTSSCGERGVWRHFYVRVNKRKRRCNMVLRFAAVLAKRGKAFFQIIAKQRQSQQILRHAPIMSGTGFPERLGPFAQIISSTAKPGERDQIDLLVFVQRADEFDQLQPRGVKGVRKVLKHIGHAVIGGVRPGIRISKSFLGVELARFDDDVANLVRIDAKLNAGRKIGIG